MSAHSIFYAEVEATVGPQGKIEVLGRAYWSPKLCNYVGWTVRVMVPRDEHEAIQVWHGSHFLASADRLLETGFVDVDGAKEVARRAAAMRRLVAENEPALTDPRPADRDRRRTASRRVDSVRSPQTLRQTEGTDSLLPLRSKGRLHTELQNGAKRPRSEHDTQLGSIAHAAAAGLSPHQEAGDCHPGARGTVREQEPRTSHQGDEAHPRIARRHCREGRPCPRVRAALASGSTVPLRDNRDDQYSWCSLGPANRFRWFICEDSDACLKAHRLRETPVQTPKKRGAARLLSAFLDLIFGRRA